MSNKKGIRGLKAAFDSATSSDEMLKVFKKMESKLHEKDLVMQCWKIAQKLQDECQDPLKILSFGKRALNIFLKTNENDSLGLGIRKSSLYIAHVLHLLGYACFELKRYDECLSYLHWADRNLSKLLENDSGNKYALHSLINTHVELSRVKKVMGRGEEVVFHFKKVLEIKENVLEKDCLEIGIANEFVGHAYAELKNYKEALPLKALEIYEKYLSNDSEEITMLSIRIGQIYFELGEFGKAIAIGGAHVMAMHLSKVRKDFAAADSKCGVSDDGKVV